MRSGPRNPDSLSLLKAQILFGFIFGHQIYQLNCRERFSLIQPWHRPASPGRAKPFPGPGCPALGAAKVLDKRLVNDQYIFISQPYDYLRKYF